MKSSRKNGEKSCFRSFFSLNSGVTNHLHDVMHGKDSVDGMKHGGLTADAYSSQGRKLLEPAVKPLDGGSFMAVICPEFGRGLPLTPPHGTQIRGGVFELPVVLSLFPASALVFQRTIPADVIMGTSINSFLRECSDF